MNYELPISSFLFALLCLSFSSCTSNVDMEKYDAAFLNCFKEEDAELFTILNDYEEFLINENYLSNSSNLQLVELRDAVMLGEVLIDRSLFIEKIFDNSFEGWFYFKPGRATLLKSCLYYSIRGEEHREFLIKCTWLLYGYSPSSEFTPEIINDIVLPKSSLESDMYKYSLLYNLVPIR